MSVSFSDKAKQIIAMIAPTLGTALGGPLGGMAGAAIATALGAKDQKAAEAAIVAQDPATLLALKKADNDFAVQMKSLGIEEEKLGYADVASARELGKVNLKPQMYLATVFIGGYFGIVLSLIVGWVRVDPAVTDFVKMMLTVLLTGIPMILQFFFGSSSGSQAKSAMLYQSKPADSP